MSRGLDFLQLLRLGLSLSFSGFGLGNSSARHPIAERHGWRAGPHPTADPTRRAVRARVHAAGRGNILVSSDSLQQLGRGMAGALIVEEPQPVAVDRDIVWMLSDWRLTPEAQIAPGFGNSMEAAMAGRVGNTVTINGRISAESPVRAGERVRLRLINAALARIMSLHFEGHRPVVIAIDGQPCAPHEPERGGLVLGPRPTSLKRTRPSPTGTRGLA
jgi:FtsP/CotA-like multicopper oxidase with cupredoxin domain